MIMQGWYTQQLRWRKLWVVFFLPTWPALSSIRAREKREWESQVN